MGLPLHSFLLLPMQRVTRFPLLVDVSAFSNIFQTQTQPAYIEAIFTLCVVVEGIGDYVHRRILSISRDALIHYH